MRLRPRNASLSTAAERARALSKWDFEPGRTPPGFETEEEIAAFEAERDRRAREAYDARSETLHARLIEWPADMWATIFIERPEWESELTEDQTQRWQAWLAEVKRRRLLETRSNMRTMPAPASGGDQ